MDFDNDYFCGSPVQFDMNLTLDRVEYNPNIQFGMSSFDNMH